MLGYAELVFVNVLSPKGTILGFLTLKSEFKGLLKAYKPTYFDGKKLRVSIVSCLTKHYGSTVTSTFKVKFATLMPSLFFPSKFSP